MAAEKTFKSALVIIPPPSLWEPIQALRRRYDRKFRRWMPHVTLLYPFRPREQLPNILPLLDALCSQLSPFVLCLRECRLFRHGPTSHTLWLSPEPAEPIITLYQRLLEIFPDCTEQGRYPTGFTPHLSIGQYYGPTAEAERLRQELSHQWQPICFCVDALTIIARDDPPDDVFSPVAVLPFGRPTQELQKCIGGSAG